MPTIQQPGRVTFVIFCNPDWTPCQKAQARAKCQHLNNSCPATRDPNYYTPNANGVAKRELADAAAAAFRRQYVSAVNGGPVNDSAPLGNDPNNYAYGTEYDLMDPCMQDDTEDGQIPTDANGESMWEVDHCVDVQFTAGAPQGPLKMLDRTVNGSLGSQMRVAGADGNPIDAFELEGCD